MGVLRDIMAIIRVKVVSQMRYTINEIIERTAPIAKQYGVISLYLFGSYARGEASSESDIDVLVEFAPGTPGLDFFGFKLDLEDALQCSVDLVTFRSLKKAQPDFRSVVEREARIIYEQSA